MGRIFIGFLVLLAFLTSPSQADERTFKKPKTGSYRVDWCYKWAKQCGEPAANRYCKTKGYDEATDFEKAEDIGDEFPTKVLGTGQICDDESCDGFKFITCDRSDEEDTSDEPIYSDKEFNKPNLAGFRIHFCFVPGGGCGQKAADTYCTNVGYQKALSYRQSTLLFGLKAPRYLGTGQICNGLDCVGFKSIICRKQTN